MSVNEELIRLIVHLESEVFRGKQADRQRDIQRARRYHNLPRDITTAETQPLKDYVQFLQRQKAISPTIRNQKKPDRQPQPKHHADTTPTTDATT